MIRVMIALLAGVSFCNVGAHAEGGEEPAGDLREELFQMPVHSFAAVKEPVSDVAPILRQYGFDLPAGSDAIFQKERRMLFIRSTRKDVNRLTRALEEIGNPKRSSAYQMVRVSANCYAYFVEPGDIRAFDRFVPTPAGIAALPVDDVRLLSSQSILTRSGQRAKVETERDEGGEDEEGEALDPAVIASFEIDPVIGNDENVIDLNLAYELVQPVGEGRARHGRISTAITLFSGSGAVFELGYLEKPKPHLLLLKIDAQIATADGKPFEGGEGFKPFPEAYFEKVK